jgi:hypothetical protein
LQLPNQSNLIGFRRDRRESGLSVFNDAMRRGVFPLFATGIGGLGLLGWRKKRKAQAAT